MAYILNVGRDISALKARAEVLRHAGYAVITTVNTDHAAVLARQATAIILGTTLSRDEKRELTQKLRDVSHAPIVCLDGHPHDCAGIGDVVLHSLDGPQLLLSALDQLLGERHSG